jgi:hypothetical protein
MRKYRHIAMSNAKDIKPHDIPKKPISAGATLLTPINAPRLLSDLGLIAPVLREVAQLDFPRKVFVTSASEIKINTVVDILHILLPERIFDVKGIKAPSEVDEEPLGQKAIDGACNRLRNGMKIVGGNKASRAAWISVENGLFRRNLHFTDSMVRTTWGSIEVRVESADLVSAFDPSAEYQDRAVVLIKIPHLAEVIEVSPSEEAVTMPERVMVAVSKKAGGFAQNTVGAMLQETGAVKDKQNPHLELSAERIGGPLPRQDQIARAIARGMRALAQKSMKSG